MKPAVAYFRTSSATNVGVDKDSLARQRQAVAEYAKRSGFKIVGEYYDAAVKGSDPIDTRPEFAAMLAYMLGNGARTILVENASRFARDLAVQIAGHDLLKSRGIDLIPVDAPDHFTEETPTAIMVRNILGAVAQFQKMTLVENLKKARDRKSEKAGRRIEGRKPVPAETVAEARKLYRKNPKTGKRRSLREIATELAKRGHTRADGTPYLAGSVAQMLKDE